MVSIVNNNDSSDKLKVILKAAQKRFGIYGLEKTTMHEIASDLGMSKASLYYYYPDKESLFKAVIETEQEEFFKLLEKSFESTDDPIARSMLFVTNHLKYFKTFFNLSRLRYIDYKDFKPKIHDVMTLFPNYL